ncbi:MAG: citrate synthase/methylcitrate synthase [Proteobacteria bacterium]|nr:citrate synthase/methylcitrate synthase [Pseudomonadota bacterium]
MSDGLEDVIVADTVLSLADSAAGRLWVRGVELPELVARHGYEGTVALLWDGFAGDGLTRDGVQQRLGAARAQAFARLDAWLPAAAAAPLAVGVRLGLAGLPDDSTPETIVATLAVGVPALLRAATGAAPLAPDPALPTTTDLLRMLHGTAPTPAAAAALDTYCVVMADSGMSPSNFTARIVASTRASLPAAVLGAWCAFIGPLHGGAPGPTLDLLDALAAAEDMQAWVEARLRARERLMGFGHRLFRGNDPRAAAMRVALERMGPASGRLALTRQAEAAVAAAAARVKPGLHLPANVEIMASVLLEAVGIDRAGFTAVFAVARAPGWIAHALEQQATGRMFRPTSRYVGPPVTP